MIQFGNDPSGAYFQPRPDCIAPSKATPHKNFVGGGYVWFDPTTMAIPGPGKFGTCGISSERGPGLKQIDMSLSKRFGIREQTYVEFRFDAINAFNTPIFAVNGYSTDVLPGDFNQNRSRYGVDPAYTASVPTGVVNTSQADRNLQFALKLFFSLRCLSEAGFRGSRWKPAFSCVSSSNSGRGCGTARLPRGVWPPRSRTRRGQRCSRDFEDVIVRARRRSQPADRHFQRALAGSVERTFFADDAVGHAGVVVSTDSTPGTWTCISMRSSSGPLCAIQIPTTCEIFC